MKTKILGALTGLLVGFGLVLVAAPAAQALTWSTYLIGQWPMGTFNSPAGTIHKNQGRINAPGFGIGYLEKFYVAVNKKGGAILASGSAVANGYWINVNVPTPQANTVARCQMSGSPVVDGDYHCEVYK